MTKLGKEKCELHDRPKLMSSDRGDAIFFQGEMILHDLLILDVSS